MRILGNIAEGRAKTCQIVADVLSSEQYPAVIGLQKPGDDLDGRGFPRAIRPEVSDDLTRAHAETHVLNGRNSAVASRKILQLKHEEYPWLALTLCSILLYAGQVACYIDKMPVWQPSRNSRIPRR